jgi:hypothetical protein
LAGELALPRPALAICASSLSHAPRAFLSHHTELSEEDKALHEKQKAEKAAIKAAADKLKGKK